MDSKDFVTQERKPKGVCLLEDTSPVQWKDLGVGLGCRTTETEGNCGSQSSRADRGNYPHMLFSVPGLGEVAPCGSSWAAALAEHCTEGAGIVLSCA